MNEAENSNDRNNWTPHCSITHRSPKKGVEIVTLQNDRILVEILPDKGADIYSFIYKPINVDVLWKSPWGIRPLGRGVSPNFNAEALWLEYYPGGCQELFPNGGDPCTYNGVELNFHGEASMVPWDYTILTESPETISVQFETNLFRSPFSLTKTITITQGFSSFSLDERIQNTAGEPMDCMWGYHPALGAPLISKNSFIDCGASHILADDTYEGENNPMELGRVYSWPYIENGEEMKDFSRLPDGRRALLAYLKDFTSGWYSVTNPDIGLSFALQWPKEVMPYAWFWQELKGSSGFPFYKNSYVMAIEPNTSIPGQGLQQVIEKTGTHKRLQPGGSMEIHMDFILMENKEPLNCEAIGSHVSV